MGHVHNIQCSLLDFFKLLARSLQAFYLLLFLIDKDRVVYVNFEQSFRLLERFSYAVPQEKHLYLRFQIGQKIANPQTHNMNILEYQGFNCGYNCFLVSLCARIVQELLFQADVNLFRKGCASSFHKYLLRSYRFLYVFSLSIFNNDPLLLLLIIHDGKYQQNRIDIPKGKMIIKLVGILIDYRLIFSSENHFRRKMNLEEPVQSIFRLLVDGRIPRYCTHIYSFPCASCQLGPPLSSWQKYGLSNLEPSIDCIGCSQCLDQSISTHFISRWKVDSTLLKVFEKVSFQNLLVRQLIPIQKRIVIYLIIRVMFFILDEIMIVLLRHLDSIVEVPQEDGLAFCVLFEQLLQYSADGLVSSVVA